MGAKDTFVGTAKQIVAEIVGDGRLAEEGSRQAGGAAAYVRPRHSPRYSDSESHYCRPTRSGLLLDSPVCPANLPESCQSQRPRVPFETPV